MSPLMPNWTITPVLLSLVPLFFAPLYVPHSSLRSAAFSGVMWSSSVTSENVRAALMVLYILLSCYVMALLSMPPISSSLFFAHTAQHGMHIGFANTTNAFQHSPPPLQPCFITVNVAYYNWYHK